MPEGARIQMGDTWHGSLRPYSMVALGGILAYISPGTSAYWADVFSHSGLILVANLFPEFIWCTLRTP
jgi:hypothetical protein